VGFIGNIDLFSEGSKSMLVGMCKVAEGIVDRKEGKTPAEVMLGGKVWHPPGWDGKVPQPLD